MQGLTNLRKKKRMSTYEFAEYIGLSQPFVCQMEKGIKNPSIKTLEMIASRTKVPLVKLIG